MNRILNKKGFVSIVVLIVMACLLPFLIFLFSDLTHVRYAETKLQHITDNACSSASMALDTNALQDGKKVINEEQATQIVKSILKSELQLNDDLSPIEGKGMLFDKPKINLKIYNNIPEQGYVIKTTKRSIKLKNTSAILEVEYPIHLAFFKSAKFKVNKISVKQLAN